MTTPFQPSYAETVSAEARKTLTPLLNAKPLPRMPSIVMRALSDQMQGQIVKRRALKGVNAAKSKMDGVPVRIFSRAGVDPDSARRMLINVHGGGFEIDAGSQSENIPLAARLDAVVVAVRYRMAPKHPFPAAVDDLLAVYRKALETRPAERIVVYGTSAGAVLTTQFLARLKVEDLPMPAAAGIFSGAADLSRDGDCEAYLPTIFAGESLKDVVGGYVGATERTDPLLSPLFSDLSGLPPTLLLTSTRDQLLSGTVILHRALRRAGVAAELEVFDGLPHAFWAWLECPETEEAFDAMAAFFDRHLAA